MKKLASLSILLFLSTFLFAQDYFKWSEPEIITDINSVYANPYLAPYDFTSWIFYEKHGENSSIYKMDVNNSSDNVLLIGSSGNDYKQAYFRYTGNPEFIGHLLYLSDEEGAFNLYAVKLFEDNSLGQVNKVIQNLENKDIMDYSIDGDGYIAFTIDSLVYAAEISFYNDSVFTVRESLLDSSSFNIRVNNRRSFWQRNENDSSLIKNSEYKYVADSGFSVWQTPIYADSIGNNTWLTNSRFIDDWGGDEFCWVKRDSILGIGNYGGINTINTFSKPNVRQLSMINWFIAVKNPYEEPHYTCFTTGLGDSSEIYSSHGEFGWEEGVYISDNDYPDFNPKVSFGEYIDWASYYVYCIWQTQIGGNIALSMAKAKAFIGSGIDENIRIDDFLKVSPNPFKEVLKIEFNNHNKVSKVQIFDIQGQEVYSYESLSSLNEWQNISWHPANKVSKGTYFVVLDIEGKKYTRKVVK